MDRAGLFETDVEAAASPDHLRRPMGQPVPICIKHDRVPWRMLRHHPMYEGDGQIRLIAGHRLKPPELLAARLDQ